MKKLVFFSLALFLFLISCKDDDDTGGDSGPNPVFTDNCNLTDIPYAPTPYDLVIPTGFPQVAIPEDNLLTEEGVQLGRFLFYDKILSSDSTMSCASCHMQANNFTDNKAVSPGVTGEVGTRSSMAIIDLVFNNDGFFWDGRAKDLEAQALEPVENPVELHEDWLNVELKLRLHDIYPKMFREAFGIECLSDITKDLAVKAIAQFERTVISSGNAKYDRVAFQQTEFLTDQELDGFLMFFDASDGALPDAECGHCHNAPLFTTNKYFNNGLQEGDINTYDDKGLGAITGNVFDNGKFRAPTLRNIELTAPYMHDGRFETLEEVLEHYNSGGHPASNVDPLIIPLNLDEAQKAAIIAFLKTLTDTDFIENPDYSDPFE